MSNFAKTFKDEVIRLARKESKAAVAPIRKPAGATRSALADLLSADLFGKLLGVSGPAVYAWENRNGPLRARQTTRTAILSIRALGAREAKAKLQANPKK